MTSSPLLAPIRLTICCSTHLHSRSRRSPLPVNAITHNMQHFLRVLVLCTIYSFCVAVHDKKFSEFFPYYGEVLGNQISGQHNVSQEQLELVGGKNCSAQYTTYLSTETARDATSACYVGVSHFLLPTITMLISR